MGRARRDCNLLSPRAESVMNLRHMGQFKVLSGLLAFTSCVSVAEPIFPISIEDVPSQNIVRVTNRSPTPINLFYEYAHGFRGSQMFFVRFRDSSASIVNIPGTDDGWFTPKIYSASLRLARRSVMFPGAATTDLPVDVGYFASWVRRNNSSTTGPCEVQIKLFGYLSNNSRAPVEAVTAWRPGPCPR